MLAATHTINTMNIAKIRLSTAATFAGAAVFVFSAASVKAAILASDSFDYALGPILGLNGGTGFSGAYTGAGSVTAPGQTYPGLTTAGNTFTTNGSDQGAFRTLAAPLGTDSGTVFVRFLGSNTGGGVPDDAGFSFFTGGSEELFLGKPFMSANYGFDAQLPFGAGLVIAPSATISATTSLLVYRLTFGLTTDTIDFFYNPGSTLGTPDATFTTPDNTIFPATFTGIRLQSGNNAPTFDYDEIVIATQAADVLIPEPSVLGLVGIAAAGLVIRRRRA